MGNTISKKNQILLLKMARESIKARWGEKSGVDQDSAGGQGILEEKRGLFVTLHKKGRLRGCIGNIEPVKSLERGVKENASFAAFKDSRFAPLSPGELDCVDIEISILSIPEKMNYGSRQDLISKLKPRVHGVIIEKNGQRATFLPQVWEQLPEPEKFLSQLCLKAGFPEDEWERGGIELYIYKVYSFGELDDR